MYTLKIEGQLRPKRDRLRTPKVRFAMVGYPRTGSSHLVSLLDSHPDIACWDDEVFGDGEVFEVDPERATAGAVS
jgi:hypothetical protein